MVHVGFPGWKLFARMGLPVRVRVAVHFDDESRTLWADSPDLAGLAVAGDTLAELLREADAAARTLVELALGDGRSAIGAVVTEPLLAAPSPA